MSWIITSDQVAAPSDAAIVYGITSTGGTFNLRSSGTVDYVADWGDVDVETSTLNVVVWLSFTSHVDLEKYRCWIFKIE